MTPTDALDVTNEYTNQDTIVGRTHGRTEARLIMLREFSSSSQPRVQPTIVGRSRTFFPEVSSYEILRDKPIFSHSFNINATMFLEFQESILGLIRS